MSRGGIELRLAVECVMKSVLLAITYLQIHETFGYET